MAYEIRYSPSGPEAAKMHQSTSFITGIAGPIGSSKSVTCCMEIHRRMMNQPRGADGFARGRLVAIRNTYAELKSTTIKTWLDWFPEDLFGKVKYDAPITQTLDLGDKRILEVFFLSIDRPEDAKKVLGLETTWVWLNEVKELDLSILTAAASRCGRFPPAKHSGSYMQGVVMDTNMMGDDHWYYRLAEVEKPEGYTFIRQPSGLSPDAENLNWLNQTSETIQLPMNHPDRIAQGRIYYERLVAGNSKSWVDVYVRAEYGSTTGSRPVHPDFSSTFHVSKTKLMPAAGLPIQLGFDFGLTPACVYAQMMPNGQLRILGESTSENMGLTQFCDRFVLPKIASEFPSYRIRTFHDPAGIQRSQADEKTCRDVLKQKGLNPGSVGSNAFMARKDSVDWFLTRLITGEPAILIDPSCTVLIEGLKGAYKFTRMRVAGEERFQDAPMKTKQSHVCEALQYLCLHFHVPGQDLTSKPLLTHGVRPNTVVNYC